jgi:molybdenum cofactor cytidylyltransferase
MHNIGVILLAAGESRRLGKAKQLLKFQGSTLLEHAIDVTSRAVGDQMIVVLGYRSDQFIPYLGKKEYVVNPVWELGMGQSLKLGLEQLMDNFPELKGVIISVIDQPFLTATHLKDIIEESHKHPSMMIASKYKGVIGVPVLFPRILFQELLKVDDRKGARELLIKYPEQMVSIPFEKGEIDIDTPEDLKYLSNDSRQDQDDHK